MIPSRLALEDGSVFHGWAFGACGVDGQGEVVFNTAHCGYQEALTDPSYAGQILTFTAPMMGNYGITAEDDESPQPQVAGVVVRELSRVPSNFRAVAGLDEWLAKAGVPGIYGIDTRALVTRLRSGGSMRGVISSDRTKSDGDLIERARSIPEMAGRDLASLASCGSKT